MIPNPRRPEQIRAMFARIAHRYDLMNRLMTGGMDLRWRRQTIQACALPLDARVLDVGSGTGDLAAEALRQRPAALVVGCDFTLPMMLCGREKPGRDRIRWVGGDALRLPFPDEQFDAVVSGFVMRNVADLDLAFREQARVTRPGGRVACLEAIRLSPRWWTPFYRFYFHRVVPWIGAIVAGDRAAYTYLPQSVEDFFTLEELAQAMIRAGLILQETRTFLFGAVALVVGVRP
ncbi:ubiquinone/menaquinone biosynthesis methyltransferase [Thermoflexus sp.]|uniref:ubiquinone/menaquinone biosynthesis methyltransferase n=1 Tax=Thermoflexus sp. TaxID=1969742 RepID=UPI0025E46DF0|nr:ubiquinone/menaquinone biosynthesis methyltransferase [Thermoflexus sp.]MDW8064393.1 ubiquinone/menaquinone biosynthesis methyltransferase [Anaerolineae bacterium]MCS6963855.1 ubiquinone/menaquinone biosynthesis methyltransferase [Thermoflexus sp.]MCS7350247.1 ubiquinone/menaquinone biosynthesis methyltransferase [Thermoflexus sp.]MCX7691448.1 ubiquinone/menaquinone biosynthesis methyltransferase [Thermoflexus sp.]MDW8065768.1 ubiquinone/menaquinone biosynthesis methyltransferase [Anaerolin